MAQKSQQPDAEDKIKPKKAFQEDAKEEEKKEELPSQNANVQEAKIINLDQKMKAGNGSDYNSAEEVDSDELDGDLNLSDDENQKVAFRSQNVAAKQAMRSKRPARVFRQEIDTNVFKIGFSTLKDQAEIATGDPEFCSKCKAIFNVHSKINLISQIGK